MKFNISDDTGSHLVAVLKLDGSPAIEGQDYAKWRGEYHKNGKWSYTEGGVALKEGIVIVHHRSTHHNSDHRNWVHTIVDNQDISENFVMGRIEETPEKPAHSNSCQRAFESIGQDVNKVWERIVNAVVEYYREINPDAVEQMLKKWEEMEKFV